MSGELSFSGVTLTFTPDGTLTLLGDVSVTVTTDVTDLEGTSLEEEFVSELPGARRGMEDRIEFANPVQVDPAPLPARARGGRGGTPLVVWAQVSRTTLATSS